MCLVECLDVCLVEMLGLGTEGVVPYSTASEVVSGEASIVAPPYKVGNLL